MPSWSRCVGICARGSSTGKMEELLAERGIEVHHVSVFPLGKRFGPLLAQATRPMLAPCGDRWWVDETPSKCPVGGATFTGRSTSSGGHRRVCVLDFTKCN